MKRHTSAKNQPFPEEVFDEAFPLIEQNEKKTVAHTDRFFTNPNFPKNINNFADMQKYNNSI